MAIIAGIIGIYIGYKLVEWSKKPHVFTSEEISAMNNEMLGKSTKECRKIVKKYKR